MLRQKTVPEPAWPSWTDPATIGAESRSDDRLSIALLGTTLCAVLDRRRFPSPVDRFPLGQYKRRIKKNDPFGAGGQLDSFSGPGDWTGLRLRWQGRLGLLLRPVLQPLLLLQQLL
jgi:hypothetical protein